MLPDEPRNDRVHLLLDLTPMAEPTPRFHPQPASTEEELPPVPRDLNEWIGFFARHWILIVGAAVLGGLGLGLAFVVVQPKVFKASASLVVVPSQFTSALKPSALSVQGYQRLLESDAIVAETQRRLVDQELLAESEKLRLNRDLQSRIFVARRAEETILAPIIEAVGRAEDARLAAAIANAWADVFVDTNRELFSGTALITADFIEQQYQRESEELIALERGYSAVAREWSEEQMKLSNRWDASIAAARARWEGRLAEARQRTEDLIAAYQLETRLRIEQLATQSDTQSDAIHRIAATEDGSALAEQLQRLVVLRTQLAQTSQFLVLERSLSDEALWETLLTGPAEKDITPIIEQRLLDQENNPVFNELALRLSEAEIEMEAVPVPDGLREEVRALRAGLETLQRERSAGLAKLHIDRAMKKARLQREQDLELASLQRARNHEATVLEREQDLLRQQFERQLEHSRDIFGTLAPSREQAALARAEQILPDVRLASPAVPPSHPEPRHILLKALIGACLGGLLGLGIARVREIVADDHR